LLAIVAGHIGVLHHERCDLDAAERRYLTAIELLHELGDRRFEGLYLGALGAVLAARRDPDAARAKIREAEQVLSVVDAPWTRTPVSIYGAHIDVELGRRGGATSEVLAVLRQRIAALRSGDTSLARTSEEVRTALRILDSAVDALATSVSPASIAGDEALVV